MKAYEAMKLSRENAEIIMTASCLAILALFVNVKANYEPMKDMVSSLVDDTLEHEVNVDVNGNCLPFETNKETKE